MVHGSWVGDRMFPKMAKCSFHVGSISGSTDVSATRSFAPVKCMTTQPLDFMCVLSYNYIYEKLCLVSIIAISFLARKTFFRCSGSTTRLPSSLPLGQFCSGVSSARLLPFAAGSF